MKNWRTTVCGVLALIAAAAQAIAAVLEGSDFDASIVIEVLIGIGLVLARDHK